MMLLIVVMVGDDVGVVGICSSVGKYVCLCESICACASRKKKREREKKKRRDII